MTNPANPTDPANSGWSASQPPGGGKRLERYFAANQATTTEEALSAAARSSGHSDEAIAAAWARVRADELAAPIRQRARAIVLAAYLLTFAALMTGMIVNSSSTIVISGSVLLVSMLIGLGLSLLMVRLAGPGAAIAAVLAGPVIVLVIVAGLCVATGLPIRSAPII
jgi:hypothetical protein